jgi:hypothetical protein
LFNLKNLSMKKTFLIGILASVLLFSCSKNETPLVADFSLSVTGESPNAQLSIINNSEGASTYTWTLGEGAIIETSTENTPTGITVDKVGNLEVKLVVGNGTEQKEITKSISITGHSAIVSYSDIAFALNPGDATYGRLFSFETGQIYKDNAINATNGSTINLAFGSAGNTMYYFESPTVASYNVPNATTTQVINYESSPTFTAGGFDAITDDRDLAGLTILENNDSFGNAQIPGTVLFQLSTGRKGVIKTKSVNGVRLMVDIKIQKY